MMMNTYDDLHSNHIVYIHIYISEVVRSSLLPEEVQC